MLQFWAQSYRPRKEHMKNYSIRLKQDGFSRIRLDGEITRLDEEEEEEKEKLHYPRLDRQKKHTIEVIVDRLKPSPQEKSRLFDSIQSALKVGEGIVVVSVDNKDTMYSQRNACPHCGISLGDLEPRTFSFNSPFGACRECNGLGIKIEFDPDLIIPDKSKSIIEGAIKPWTGHFATFRSAMLRDVGRKFGFDLATPLLKMNAEQVKVILYGEQRENPLHSTNRAILTADGNIEGHLKASYQTLSAFTAKPNQSQSAKT